MSAREYYYKVIAPEERGQNYQQVYQRYLYESGQPFSNNEIQNQILSYVPHLSNDALIEAHIQELIRRNGNSARLQQRLSQLFVAKRKQFQPEAYSASAKRTHHYSGDLAFFHVGLSDACFQYTTLFAELIYLKQLRYKLDDNNPLVKYLVHVISEHTNQLAIAQEKWKMEGDYIDLDFTTVLEVEKLAIPDVTDVTNVAVNVAGHTDKFILGHEIAHHVLGHTGQENDGLEIIQSLPPTCQFWQNATKGHAREFQSDALAICLVAGVANPWNESQRRQVEEEIAVEASLGALLTMTVLGQLSANVVKASETHPSIRDRFEQCRHILGVFVPPDIYNAIEDDVLRFQHLLFISQGHGLGENTVGLFKEDN
jgi:hypothetical protein